MCGHGRRTYDAQEEEAARQSRVETMCVTAIMLGEKLGDAEEK